MYPLKGNTIGMFSDIHIGLSQDSPMWHKEVLNIANWIKESFENEGINDIIIPGDVFHNRNEISVNTISIAKDFFEILKGFRIFISTGNHDCYYKDKSDINSVSIFNGWNNIIVVDKSPAILKYKDKTISLIPWGTSIEDIPKSEICFGHFEINSFYMNTFKLCTHGVESKNILKKSPFVISGHFHNKEERSYKNGKILYLGSPYQHNFGDIDQIRGIYTLNLNDNSTKFIENTFSPKHIKIHLSEIQTDEKKLDAIKSTIKDNIISFIVDSDITSDDLDKITTKIQSLVPKSLRVDFKNVDMDNGDLKSSESYDILNIEETITDYVGNTDMEHKEEVIEYLIASYKNII